MSIRFDCVGCNRSLVVHDRLEGRNVRCPNCSFELLVPPKAKKGDAIPRTSDEPFVAATAVPAIEGLSITSLDQDAGEQTALVEKEPIVPQPPKQGRRSIRKDHGDEEEELEWDITPMVDVAFLLLIFFMLTASFSIQKVLRSTPPQSNQPSKNSSQVQLDEKTDKISIQIDEFNAYTVVLGDGQTHEASSKQELISILKDYRTQAGDQLPRIVIQAHMDSLHGATVGCMDAARAAEFTDFQLYAVESFD